MKLKLLVLPILTIVALLVTMTMEARGVLLDQNFDGLESQLQSAVDENIDPMLLGWTHSTPTGWSIDNSNMPSQPGTAEWQGWSFTTMPFWTAADTQGRETFASASGVLAVADPDEWDDTGSPSSSGDFDSTLIAPPIAVAAGQTTYLSFHSHYQQEGDQTAEVTISFDGGAEQVVLRYDENAGSDNGGGDVLNEFVNVALPAPQDSADLTVKFRLYDAGNNWFWAIDNVKVTFDPGVPPSPTPAPTLPPTTLGNKRVLYIGLDGLRGDSISPANTPNMDALIADGAFQSNLLAGVNLQDTSSAPGWSTLMTGVWATKHNVFDNGDFFQNDYANYPHFVTHIEAYDPAIKTASIVHWGPINDWIAPSVTDIEETYSSDVALANRAADLLGANDAPHVTFLHFDDIDGRGHSCCFSPTNTDYLAEVADTDALLGIVFAAVENRPNYAQEDWLILITSDHGGSGVVHGGQTHDEQNAFLIINNSGTADYCSGDIDGYMTHVDVLPHIFDFLDIPINPAWEWDGFVHPACSGDTSDQATYEDAPASPLPIADNACGAQAVVRTINVPDNITIADLDFGVTIEHPFRSDVEVTLQSPEGSSADLIVRTASTNIDNFDIQLNDETASPLNDGNNDDIAAPIYDRMGQPSNPLAIFDGENAQGDWTLTICDVAGADVGSYQQSQLFITSEPPPTAIGLISERIVTPTNYLIALTVIMVALIGLVWVKNRVVPR